MVLSVVMVNNYYCEYTLAGLCCRVGREVLRRQEEVPSRNSVTQSILPAAEQDESHTAGRQQ